MTRTIAQSRWCTYGQHWVRKQEISASGHYCRKHNTEYYQKYRALKEQRGRQSEVEQLKKVLALILTCIHCQSRGFIVNQHNQVFMCDCRRQAQKVLNAKETKTAKTNPDNQATARNARRDRSSLRSAVSHQSL